jgi:hypothetical protein
MARCTCAGRNSANVAVPARCPVRQRRCSRCRCRRPILGPLHGSERCPQRSTGHGCQSRRTCVQLRWKRPEYSGLSERGCAEHLLAHTRARGAASQRCSCGFGVLPPPPDRPPPFFQGQVQNVRGQCQNYLGAVANSEGMVYNQVKYFLVSKSMCLKQRRCSPQLQLYATRNITA